MAPATPRAVDAVLRLRQRADPGRHQDRGRRRRGEEQRAGVLDAPVEEVLPGKGDHLRGALLSECRSGSATPSALRASRGIPLRTDGADRLHGTRRRAGPRASAALPPPPPAPSPQRAGGPLHVPALRGVPQHQAGHRRGRATPIRGAYAQRIARRSVSAVERKTIMLASFGNSTPLGGDPRLQGCFTGCTSETRSARSISSCLAPGEQVQQVASTHQLQHLLQGHVPRGWRP